MYQIPATDPLNSMRFEYKDSVTNMETTGGPEVIFALMSGLATRCARGQGDDPEESSVESADPVGWSELPHLKLNFKPTEALQFECAGRLKEPAKVLSLLVGMCRCLEQAKHRSYVSDSPPDSSDSTEDEDLPKTDPVEAPLLSVTYVGPNLDLKFGGDPETVSLLVKTATARSLAPKVVGNPSSSNPVDRVTVDLRYSSPYLQLKFDGELRAGPSVWTQGKSVTELLDLLVESCRELGQLEK